MRIPTYAFGHKFTHIPEHVRQDIDTLNRESAIYTDHWIEEIGDFRHVRIRFTSEERDDFFRRSWAYELFLKAGSPTWAAETPGIDQEIAKEADSYSMRLADGTQIPPPYHCFAAFLGVHLEALVCTRTDREDVIELQGRELKLFEVRRTIEALTPTIRSFNRREKNLSPWTVSCEKDARDLLYVMLRPQIYDIIKEEVIPSTAGSYKIADLCSKSVPFLIELKWIGEHGRWKRIMNEIHVDIQTYTRHPASCNLFFVIVDSVKGIPDPRQIESELTGVQNVHGGDINIQVIVCDT